MTDILMIARSDDRHLCLCDGDALTDVAGDTACQFGRAIIMPNLKPSVTTTAQTRTYRECILATLPAGTQFEPLMTLYLIDSISPEVIRETCASGFVHGVKLYPTGATTNSDAGAIDLRRCAKMLEAMQEVGMPLLVHGEVTDPTVDIFDREVVFTDTVMLPPRRDFPVLKVMFEYIITKHAAEYVRDAEGPVGATTTAHHLPYNRNALFVSDIRPHYYCLPVLKCEMYRLALVTVATSGHSRFFLGTDSVPHVKGMKEHACGCTGCYTVLCAVELYAEVSEDASVLGKLEGFASFHGSDFYGLPRNAGTLMLTCSQWQFPAEVPFGEQTLVSSRGGETLRWKSA